MVKVRLDNGSIGFVEPGEFFIIGSIVKAKIKASSVDMSKPYENRFSPAEFAEGVVVEIY